jgi:hypothetical protein
MEILRNLDNLIESKIQYYLSRLQNDQEDQNKIIEEFKSSLAKIGSDALHSAILDGHFDNLTVEVQNRLNNAMIRLLKLKP